MLSLGRCCLLRAGLGEILISFMIRDDQTLFSLSAFMRIAFLALNSALDFIVSLFG
jgi:hypothetical protein